MTRTLALAVVLTLSLPATFACASRTATTDAAADAATGASALDAGAPVAVITDAGVILGDAGIDPPPDAGGTPAATASQDVDGGTKQAPRPTPSAGPASASSASEPSGGGKMSVYDRILAKPKEGSPDLEGLRALVEVKTGEKVAAVRKSAAKWVLFTFAAKPGDGRTRSEQAQLVNEMLQTGVFQSVEGDRMMQVKQP